MIVADLHVAEEVRYCRQGPDLVRHREFHHALKLQGSIEGGGMAQKHKLKVGLGTDAQKGSCQRPVILQTPRQTLEKGLVGVTEVRARRGLKVAGAADGTKGTITRSR